MGEEGGCQKVKHLQRGCGIYMYKQIVPVWLSAPLPFSATMDQSLIMNKRVRLFISFLSKKIKEII